MRKRNWRHYLLYSAFVIPVGSPQGWQTVKFSKVPANVTNFSEKGLEIAVKNSAGPVVFTLPSEKIVKEVQIKGQIVSGGIKIPEGLKQGDKGADDYVLRLGLVVAGSRKMGFVQRQLSPPWMRSLFMLPPKGTGIDHILFLNLGQQKGNQGQSRVHPVSDLLREKVQWTVTDNNEFKLDADLDKPTKTLALWLAADGDDTQSEYTLLIKEIKLYD